MLLRPLNTLKWLLLFSPGIAVYAVVENKTGGNEPLSLIAGALAWIAGLWLLGTLIAAKK